MNRFIASLFVSILSVFSCSAVAQVVEECTCACPEGKRPRTADVRFKFVFDKGKCLDEDELKFEVTSVDEEGCANFCANSISDVDFSYNGHICPASPNGPTPYSGSTTASFSATPGGAGTNKNWRLTFYTFIPLGGIIDREYILHQDGTITAPGVGVLDDADGYSGNFSCDSASVSFSDPFGDESWSLTFSTSTGCEQIGPEGADGSCGQPSESPVEEDNDDDNNTNDPGRRGSSNFPWGFGSPTSPEGDFPSTGDKDDCNGSGNESGSPVAYLTGHKVERATDLVVRLPGKDFRIDREYTSNPNFYYRNDGDFLWNGRYSNIEPGTVGVRWTLGVFRYLTGDIGDDTDRLYLSGQPMRSRKQYDLISGQGVFTNSGSSNSYIEAGSYASIGWLDTAGLFENGANVKVWRLRNPGGGELVFMRQDDDYASVDNELDRTDLNGVLLYEIDAYGNTFEYEWTTLGTGNIGREIVRLDRVLLKGSTGTVHARVLFDWQGEAGTGLPSSSIADNATWEWLYGRLDEIRVERPTVGGAWDQTQRVQYVHFDEIQNINSQDVFGNTLGDPHENLGWTYDAQPGDLCEVIVSKRVDEGGDAAGMHAEVTQYRYYAPNNEYGYSISGIANNSVVSELEGFVASGEPHQLMAVLYPQQIEYYAGRVFNEFEALGTQAGDIASALGIQESEVPGFQTDVYSSSQSFGSVVQAAERLRWVNFHDGFRSYVYSQATLLPNSDWSSLFDLSGKFVTYYDDNTALYGETNRVRTQLVSSSASGCGCSGAGPALGLGIRYDYMYRRYKLGTDIVPPSTVSPDLNIVSDGYSCLIAESYLDTSASTPTYIPYRVHCNDYYWPTSYPNGIVAGSGAVTSRGIRRIARALCSADTNWGSAGKFDPYQDPILHSGPKWATTRVYGNDSVDPTATQFDNYAKLTAVLSMDAVAASDSGYSAVKEAGTSTVTAVIPQSSEAGVVVKYDYTAGYLTKQTIEDGTEQAGPEGLIDVVAELSRGGANDRPDLVTQQTSDAGDGVVHVESFDYGYYNNSQSTDINGAILAWTKSSMSPESASQNGPSGTTSIDYSEWSFFDRNGQLRWTRDAGGTLSYYEYDEHTGQIIRMTRDADPGDSSIPADIQINASNFAGITAAGWTLPFRTAYDELTDTYAYDLLGRQVESTDAAGVTRYTRRIEMNSGSPITSNYVKWVSISGVEYGELKTYGVGMYAVQSFPHKLVDGTFDGPVSVSWQDAAGSSLRSSSFECQSSGGSYDPSSSMYSLGAEYSRSDSELTVTGSTIRSRQWFDVSQTASASAGSFYTETRYDGLGRTYQVIDPLGGVTQYGTDTVPGYDIMDRSLAMASGVKNASGLITVELVSESFYDSNRTETQGIGNGLLSVSKVYTGEGTESRSTKYWYDFRDRMIAQKNPESPHQLFGYDSLGRLIEQASWTDGSDLVEEATGSVPSPSSVKPERSSYSKTFYNNRGMPYRRVQAIDPTKGPGDLGFAGYLETFTWYDPEGRAVVSWGPNGGASKTRFDHLGRPLASYMTDRSGDVLPGPGSYESIFDSAGLEIDISDDHVLSQTEYRYILGGNPGAGRTDLVTSRMRLHDTTDVGELDGTNSIAMFSVSHFDDASRVTDSLSYGTNDSVSSNQYKSGTTAPTTIDLNRSTSPALISSIEFDSIGRNVISIDPAGRKSYRLYDDLSRTYATIENYQTGFESQINWDSGTQNWTVNWGLAPAPDQNRVTTFTFDSNSNVIKQTAHLSDGSVQVTENEYGVNSTAGLGVMESRISSPKILAAVHYPNKSTGQADSSAAYTVSYSYNRLGEPRGRTDQNGTQHAFVRDNAGRVISDEVVSFGTGVDTAVAKITTKYDDHGRLEGVYTWDDSSTPVKLTSVEYEYTPMHQIETLTQNVDEDGGAVDGVVKYEYTNAEPSASGGNYSRLTGVRYPSQENGFANTFELDYSGAINESLSRVHGIDVPGWSKDKQLVRYTYAGPGMAVKVAYPSGSIGLDMTKGPDGSSASGEYPGFDRFGRTVWHAWVNNAFDIGQNIGGIDYPNATPLVARRYGYDEVTKNRTRDWDGRPGGVLTDRDWEHNYDEFNRLITSSRGQWDSTLSTPSLVLSAGSRQWDLDMLGNWNSVSTDLNGINGFEAGDETELRTHNLANELLSREGEPGSGPGGSTPILNPTYDDAGNYVQNGGSGAKGLKYIYDAWNRLVRVERKVSGGANFSILENEYNALGWRVIRRVDTASGAYDGLDEERRYYFNTGWQMIEEHVDKSYSSGSTFSKDYASQQFWGMRYIDDAVAKRIDRDNDGDWAEAADQYFYLTDSMFSVRALADSGGYVRERIDYTPYGVAMHRYAGDYNGDGAIGIGDLIILNAQSGGTVDPGDSGYNPHVDLNGDGVLDGTDVSIFLADNAYVTTNGNGVPPDGWLGDPDRTSSDGTDNAFGYDGYWFDAAGATDAGTTGLYAVRNRVYDPGLGRWLTRDPAGYVDGYSKYMAFKSSPIMNSDMYGLASRAPTLVEGDRSVDAVNGAGLSFSVSRENAGIFYIYNRSLTIRSSVVASETRVAFDVKSSIDGSQGWVNRNSGGNGIQQETVSNVTYRNVIELECDCNTGELRWEYANNDRSMFTFRQFGGNFGISSNSSVGFVVASGVADIAKFGARGEMLRLKVYTGGAAMQFQNSVSPTVTASLGASIGVSAYGAGVGAGVSISMPIGGPGGPVAQIANPSFRKIADYLYKCN